jgi:hypothetical protein
VRVSQEIRELERRGDLERDERGRVQLSEAWIAHYRATVTGLLAQRGAA